MPENFTIHQASPGEAAPHIYSVSELTYLIKGNLESEFGQVWIEGEISGYREAQSGHAYFTLKDAHSQIRGVMFRFRKKGVRFDIEDGLKVVVSGQVTVYVPRGEYQIIVESMEPLGAGALQLAFEQLKARLQAEGLFDEEHKKEIPYLPERVGVITSPTGAAIRDIINITRRRFAGVGLLLYPVRVQGEGASGEIARALADLNRYGRVEVIILGRGGGSLEDLWAFNEEEVARAVFDSKIPVISAVGHEIDFTISDFVADLRAPTPSAAAEIVVKNRLTLARELDSLESRLRVSVRGLVSAGGSRLESLASRRVLCRPEYLLMVPGQRLDETRQSLARVVRQAVSDKRLLREKLEGRLARFDPRTRLSGFRRDSASLSRRLSLSLANLLEARERELRNQSGKLQALSPLAVLSRGYSVCRTLPGKRVIADAGLVSRGETVNVILSRGELDCRVEKIRDERAQSNEQR
jgi:exodeoxyribonuclease VII large subunit